jgi:hypothetical protein
MNVFYIHLPTRSLNYTDAAHGDDTTPAATPRLYYLSCVSCTGVKASPFGLRSGIYPETASRPVEIIGISRAAPSCLNRVQNDSFLCKSQLGLYYMGPMAHSWLVNILESRQQNDIYVTHSTLLNHEWVLFTPQKNLKGMCRGPNVRLLPRHVSCLH